jgi:hypothetical protein
MGGKKENAGNKVNDLETTLANKLPQSGIRP